jgi:hypothetical protein
MAEITPHENIVKLNDDYYYACYKKCEPLETNCTVACGVNTCKEDDEKCNTQVQNYTKPLYKIEGNNMNFFLEKVMDNSDFKIYQDNKAYISKEYVNDKLIKNQANFIKQIKYLDETENPRIDDMMSYDYDYNAKDSCVNMYPCKDLPQTQNVCCEAYYKNKSIEEDKSKTTEQIEYTPTKPSPIEEYLGNIMYTLYNLPGTYYNEEVEKKIINIIETYKNQIIKLGQTINFDNPENIKKFVDTYIENIIKKNIKSENINIQEKAEVNNYIVDKVIETEKQNKTVVTDNTQKNVPVDIINTVDKIDKDIAKIIEKNNIKNHTEIKQLIDEYFKKQTLLLSEKYNNNDNKSSTNPSNNNNTNNTNNNNTNNNTNNNNTNNNNDHSCSKNNKDDDNHNNNRNMIYFIQASLIVALIILAFILRKK